MVADYAVPGLDRRFLTLVGFSLALHAALFAWVKGPVRERPLATTLISATLRLVAPSTAAAAVEQRSERAPAAAQREARQLPPSRGNRPVREVAGAAAPQTRNAAAPAEAGPQPLAAPAPAAASTATAGQAVAEAPATTARSQASLLDAYGRHLAELLARQQEYPRVAALRGWEGEVRLRLKVARKGNLLAVNLDRSSGFDVLDQHAMAMLGAFGSLPPLPEGLEANEIQVVVPVNYKLKKTT